MDLDSIEALITEMKKRRALWDTKVSGYHNRQVVWEEWKRVEENTGLTKEAAKSKWKNLRDTFKKELKKGLYGDCQNDPSQYNGSWPHFGSMLFLKSAFQQRALKKKNAQDIPFQNQDSLESANYDEHEFTPVVSHIEFLGESASDVGSTSDQEPKSFKQSDINEVHQEIEHGARKKRKRNRDFKHLLELENRKLALLAPVPDDEDLLFFKSLIPHVKKLKDLRKLHFRSRVLHVLTEELHKDSNTDNLTVTLTSNITKL